MLILAVLLGISALAEASFFEEIDIWNTATRHIYLPIWLLSAISSF